MAEMIINHHSELGWQAYSAGTQPAGFVHPLAIQVLEEIGIHTQGTSKHVDVLRSIPFNLVVTVCDSAAEECPVWLGPGIRVHHSFPDPAKVTGTEAQILAKFREVRDRIRNEIPEIITNAIL